MHPFIKELDRVKEYFDPTCIVAKQDVFTYLFFLHTTWAEGAEGSLPRPIAVGWGYIHDLFHGPDLEHSRNLVECDVYHFPVN